MKRRKSNKSAADRTLSLSGVSTRETHNGYELPPPQGVTLIVLRRDGYKVCHLAKWETMLSLTKPLCEDEDVVIGTLSTEYEIDRSGRPPAEVCNACFAEASRIKGVYRK